MKKIIVLMLVISLLIPMGIAFANGGAQATRQPAVREQVQERAPKLQDRLEFAKKSREFNMEIRKTHAEFVALKKENNKLTQEIRLAVAGLANKKTIDEETLKGLMESIKNVNSIRKDLKDTLGTVKGEWTSFRQSRVNADHNTALASQQKVISIQQARVEILKKINAELIAIKESLETL